MNAQLGECIGIASVILGLMAPPAFCHIYEANLEAKAETKAVADAVKAGGAKSAKLHVYHLTGVAVPGMWTEDTVEGWNYWWRTPRRFSDMSVNKGDTVLITLASSDVEHGFTIPALGFGHVEVKPGHFSTLSFVADRAGSFPFLCAKVCSCTGTGFACNVTKKKGHEGMTGLLTVTEPLGPPDVSAVVTVSEEKGFDPPLIKAHEGDVVEVTVTSQSKGNGSGVGFCISDYESKVDLQGIGLGETRKFKFKADKAGSFTIYSSTQTGGKIDSANGQFVVSAVAAPHRP